MARTRGIGLVEAFSRLAELRDASQVDGAINLREVIGESTQELKNLEDSVIMAILHPRKEFRRTNALAVDLVSYGTIKDVYVRNNKIFLKLQGSIDAYVCDVPDEYLGEKVYDFAP